MPGGSSYQGPADVLAAYTTLVQQAGEEVKGAKNPYTSHNGHMYSFLDKDGAMALRLSDELADGFLGTFESGPVIQYGSVMRGYVSIPDDLLRDPEELGTWFDASLEWIGTLPPRATRK